MPRRSETRIACLSRHLVPLDLPPACASSPTALISATAAEEPVEVTEMTDTEKFMFDLQGYLIVPAFLSPQEVDALNAAFDANWDLRRVGTEASKRQAYDQFYGCACSPLSLLALLVPERSRPPTPRVGSMLEWPAPHCQIFRDLLAHPKLVPYLNTMFGRGWKADHEPFMLTGTAEMSASRAGRAGGADGGMSVHGGTAREFKGSTYYEYNNGQIRNGLSNCVYILKDIDAGDGKKRQAVFLLWILIKLKWALFR